MIKKCNVCSHIGELTWRDGNYYCAMCGSKVEETQPQVQVQAPVQPTVVAANVVCPICRNKENNQFDGSQYRCSMCGTSFDLQQAAQAQQYEYSPQQFNGFASKQKIDELKKQKDRKILIGIVCVFLFWPASIYFFYKAYKIHQELKELGY